MFEGLTSERRDMQYSGAHGGQVSSRVSRVCEQHSTNSSRGTHLSDRTLLLFFTQFWDTEEKGSGIN